MSPDVTTGWQILKTTASALREDKLSIIASGVAFRVMLAIFPGAALLVWLLERIIGKLGPDKILALSADIVPESARAILERAASSPLAADPFAGSALGTFVPYAGLLFVLWAANGGMKALFDALNAIYDSPNRRSFARLYLLTLSATLVMLFSLIIVVALTLAVPFLLPASLTSAETMALKLIRWPILLVCMAGGLAVLYRVAPSRGRKHWPLITVGSATASVCLVATSSLFSWVAQTFANLSLTYGSLSTIAAFMIWLWLSFLIVLACAKLDAVIDRKTNLYAAS